MRVPAIIGPALAAAAVALTHSHEHAPPLDVLDVVFRGHAGATFDPAAPWARPAAPFGQLLAAAFDRGMPPADWAAWSAPSADPVLRLALARVWRDVVLARFAARFGLTVCW